jgi:quinol monooxygenase YgiN
MSVHVTTEFKTRPECTEQALNKLRGVPEESLQCDGCEAIHLRRGQDDPTHIISFTRWARREDCENYLAWRTETGFKDEMTALLTEPQTITFFDDIVSLTR